MRYIVVKGNLSDGFTFWGPFAIFEDAEEWAEAHSNGEWWIATLDRIE